MEPVMQTLTTDVLEIGYLAGGPEDGPRVLLLHGWPDDVRGWRQVTPLLERAGLRWAAPWLRGFGPTRFRDETTLRDGSVAALAADAFAFADAIGWDSFAVVGHDWGGRAAYAMSALHPERLQAAVALAIGYAPRGRFVVPAFAQARRWWYQWLMATDGGAAAVRGDPVGFARIQWDSWSPPGWFDETEFAATAQSFRNPDWVDITLHGYRSRWREERLDPRYDVLRQRIDETERLQVPTLFIQGGGDHCDPPEESEGLEAYFPTGYRRAILDGVGHFPAREAPSDVASLVTGHVARAARV